MWEALFASHISMAQGPAELGRRPVCQRAVRPLAIVFLTPVVEGSPDVAECAELVCVEAFVAQPSMEAFDVPVLHGSSWLYVNQVDRLHTTHSTISRSLKVLTSGLGINLFDKTPYGMKPSRVGQVYGTQIRKSLEQAKLAFNLARYETSLHQRPFCVGHSPYIHGSILPLLEQLTLLGSGAPPIALRSATTMRLVWRVRREELQAGFGILPIIDKALWIERIAHEPFYICLAEHHRLATRSRLAVSSSTMRMVSIMPSIGTDLGTPLAR